MILESPTVDRPPARKEYKVSSDNINSKMLDEILLYRYHLIGVENYLVKAILQQFKPINELIAALMSDKNPELMRLLSIGRLQPSVIPIKESVEVAVPYNVKTIMEARKPGAKSPLSPQGASAVADYVVSELGPRVGGVVNAITNMIQQAVLQIVDIEPRIVAGLLRKVLPIARIGDLPLNIMASILVGGAKYANAMQNRYGKVMNKVNGALLIGLLKGKGINEIAKDLRGVVGKELASGSAMLARTEIQRAAAKAGKELYGRNKDIIKAEMWVGTLDKNICLVCANLDGRRFAVGSGPQPIDDTHPGCRCLRTPITKSWRELGINIDSLPPSTRAAMDGAIPGRVTFDTWLKRQSAKVQREVLGRTRYELYKSGEFELGQFVNNNKVLTIKQLKRRYKL